MDTHLSELQNQIFLSLRDKYKTGQLESVDSRRRLGYAESNLQLSRQDAHVACMLPKLVLYIPHKEWGMANLFCANCQKFGTFKALNFAEKPRALLDIDCRLYIDTLTYRCRYCGLQTNGYCQKFVPRQLFVERKKFVLSHVLSLWLYQLTVPLGVKKMTSTLNSIYQDHEIAVSNEYLKLNVKIPSFKRKSQVSLGRAFQQQSRNEQRRLKKISKKIFFSKHSLNRVLSMPRALKDRLRAGGIRNVESLASLNLNKATSGNGLYERLFQFGFNRPRQRQVLQPCVQT